MYKKTIIIKINDQINTFIYSTIVKNFNINVFD